MKPPRLRIRTLMILVAGSALATWGLVRLPALDHFEASIVLGILLGAGSWVVPLAAVCIVLRFHPRRYRRPDLPEPEDSR